MTTNSTNLPNLQNLNPQEESIIGSFFNLILTSGKKAFELALGELLFILNIFFKGVLGEMQGITMEAKDVKSEYQRSVSLLNAIRKVMQDPIFQQEIRKLTGLLETALKPILEIVSKLIEQEGEDLGKSAYKLTNTLTRNVINGLEDGLDGAVAAVPIVGSIWEAVKIITLGIQSGAEISITFLDAATKIANAYIEIIGNVSKPIADVLQSAIRIFDLIRNARENVINATDAASQYVDSIQPTALKRKVNQASQQVAQNVNKQLEQKTRQATQNVNKQLEQKARQATQNVNKQLEQKTRQVAQKAIRPSQTVGGKKKLKKQ